MREVLHLGLAGAPPHVTARREAEVPQAFWLELWAEWGTVGSHPGEEIELPLETFLSRTGWLVPACRRHQVSLDWAPELRSIMTAVGAEQAQLTSLLAAPTPLDAGAVGTRLAGSRFTRDLRPFQVRDLGILLGLPHGANFSVPGTGKTTVAYATYEAERLAGRVQQLVVVAPISAFDAWRSEAVDCFIDPPTIGTYRDAVPGTEVTLVNYHRLASNYANLAGLVQQTPTMVILDEAHRMKRGWDGQWGAACLSLAFLATRRDILTGTPAPNLPSDFVALVEYLWPGQARRVLPASALGSPPSSDAGHLVANAIRPLFARTRKSELHLRAPELNVVTVEPDRLQAAIYDALRDQYAGMHTVSMGDRVQLAHMGDIVMYLLEAATNPKLLSAGSSDEDAITFRHPPLAIPHDSRLWDLVQQYHQYETPAKFVTLAQMVADNARAGRKTLIWSNFVRNLLSLQRMFAGYQPALVYGAIPSELSAGDEDVTREMELDRFRNDPDSLVLLANPASMSEGVSLHRTCHDAIFVDRTFNAGQYLQSLDRIHRLGLDPETDTRISLLVTTGTIDEVVNDRIRIKAERLGEMLEDPDLASMALPDDENYGPAIDTHDDLVALFAHLRGDQPGQP